MPHIGSSPSHLIEEHHPEWISDQHFPIVFTQEFQRPRPTKKFKGTAIKPAPEVLGYLGQDPTEARISQITQKFRMIYSPNLDVPQNSTDHFQVTRLRECQCTWDLQHIKHQSLWGDPYQEDAEWDRMQQEHISARRQRFREPSPTGTFRKYDENMAQGDPSTGVHVTLKQTPYLKQTS